ncbi:MAG: NIPSNAP family protein [Pirellulales bacterium]|nr:NIPSNAP family protein [Pirellulales bacterium]
MRQIATIGLLAVLCALSASEPILAADPAPDAARADQPAAPRAYGQWRIQIKPDQLDEYAKLIETKGLPLFRVAGGRVVGWWRTMVGDLYEHVTIWEYDNLAAFEQAGQKLGGDQRFAEFAKLRDPLLAGEQSCFLHLAEFADRPALPEQAKIVVHEVHRVTDSQRDAYLLFMQNKGLPMLKSHGFRPVGPWLTGIGNRGEVTYLFLYDSLAERDRLLAAFARGEDARAYETKLSELIDEATTRVLVPADFAHRAAEKKP